MNYYPLIVISVLGFLYYSQDHKKPKTPKPPEPPKPPKPPKPPDKIKTTNEKGVGEEEFVKI